MRCSRYVVALLLVVLAVGCGARLVPLTPSASVLLPQAQQQDAIRAALARALTARQFVAESEEPGRIIARYQRRAQVLRIQIDYSDTQYQITYLDSVGLGHEVDETGQTMISAHYPRYVRALSQTIDQELGRPAREAEEAEERERQHQLALAQQETAREQAQIQAEQQERHAARNAELERERLRTARAQAEAEARRPVIVQAPNQGAVVGELAFDRRSQRRAGYGVLRARGRRFGGNHDGIAGGPNDAASMRFPDYCRGWFSEEPSHVLVVDRSRPVRIAISSQADTTLAIVTSDGNVWCDDDGAGGLNPRIEGQFPAGSYYVWVGTYRAGQQAPYDLHFTEYDAEPAVVEAPRRVAMSDARFAGILRDYAAVPVYAQQPGAAAGYVRAGNFFTCAQIAQMIQSTHVYGMEVEVAVALWQGVVDPENAHLITAAFRVYANGPAFRAQVGL